MNTELTLTETLVAMGEVLGLRRFHLYMDGHDDYRVDFQVPAAIIALIYNTEEFQVVKDLEAIAKEKFAKLIAKQAGQEMVAEHGDAMTQTAIAGIRHLIDEDRKG
jgi:hypothetical protein